MRRTRDAKPQPERFTLDVVYRLRDGMERIVPITQDRRPSHLSADEVLDQIKKLPDHFPNCTILRYTVSPV